MSTVSPSNFIATSIKNPSKSKCGDASYANTTRIDGEDCILLIVADGVSKAPRDWLASRSTVETIVINLGTVGSTKPVNEAIKWAVQYTNSRIISGVEDIKGMLSTLSLVVYQPIHKKLFIVNIGDSRIYGMKNSNLELLTIDNSTSSPYKENGKIKLQDGIPIMIPGLTQAIGYTKNLDVNIQELNSTDFDAIILSSDGFYSLPGFEVFASRLLNSADMYAEAPEIRDSIIYQINDDASFAVLRFSSMEKIDLKNIVNRSDEKVVIPNHSIQNALEEGLKDAANKNDLKYLEELLEFMEKKNLYLNKKTMIDVLEVMIQNKSFLVHRMSGIIRKL